MKIIFIGTAEFGLPILEKLIASDYQPEIIITAPDKPAGRHNILTASPIKKAADKWQLPVWQPERISKIEDKIKAIEPDLIIVVAYGQILPKSILDLPKNGSLNIHGSLLPKYRGPSPIQTAILNGETETGVTLMLMDHRIDHGPTLAQKKLAIEVNDTFQTLHDKLAFLAADLLIESLPGYLNGDIVPSIQDESKVTTTKILKRQDGQIDLTRPALDIERQIKAYFPWPGTWVNYKGKRLKILKAKVSGSEADHALKTAHDYLLPQLVQGEGKKPMSWDDYLRGL